MCFFTETPSLPTMVCYLYSDWSLLCVTNSSHTLCLLELFTLCNVVYYLFSDWLLLMSCDIFCTLTVSPVGLSTLSPCFSCAYKGPGGIPLDFNNPAFNLQTHKMSPAVEKADIQSLVMSVIAGLNPAPAVMQDTVCLHITLAVESLVRLTLELYYPNFYCLINAFLLINFFFNFLPRLELFDLKFEFQSTGH